MADFTIKQNDTWPPLTATLKGDGGAVIDLTEAAEVRILLKSDTVTIKTGPVDIIDAVNGKISYEWEAAAGEEPADTAFPGTYKMEFEITWGPGKVQSVPNDSYKELEIVEELG